jgi:transposase
MDKRRIYEGAFKARVVTEYLAGKSSLADLAKKYELHPNQIKNWKSLLLKRACYVLEDGRRFSIPERMVKEYPVCKDADHIAESEPDHGSILFVSDRCDPSSES